MALHQETELPGVLLRNVMMGFVAAAIAACQSAPPEAGSAEAGAFPTDAYQRAAERGDPVFDFDTAASTLRVYAYRSGPLAQKGHNHVIVARDWRGALALDPEELGDSRLDLRIPAAGLQVDPPGVRAELGGAFGGELDAAARTGTRENMLGARLLDAEAYPVIAISLVGVTGELPRPILTLAVTVRGNRTEIDVPVAVSRQNGGIRAEGRAVLRHEDLGLAPFTAAGGALRVAEALMVAFELVGERRRPDD
jgi:hypothetical protein